MLRDVRRSEVLSAGPSNLAIRGRRKDFNHMWHTFAAVETFATFPEHISRSGCLSYRSAYVWEASQGLAQEGIAARKPPRLRHGHLGVFPQGAERKD